MMNITPVVKQLLIINIIFFIGSQLVAPANDLFSLSYFENNHFRFWQPLTHMFMHANVMHIAFNMFALYSFGSTLEHFWGGKKFLFFYISCGLGAMLLHSMIDYFTVQNLLSNTLNLNLTKDELHQIMNVKFDDGSRFYGNLFAEEIKPILEKGNKLNLLNETNFKALFDSAVLENSKALGASGAVYGLFTALAFMFPEAEMGIMLLPFRFKAKYFVPAVLLIDLFLGLNGQSIFGAGSTGIAHFAHLGGALTGFIMMWYWKKNQFNKNRWN